jgi:hypothetical protein
MLEENALKNDWYRADEDNENIAEALNLEPCAAWTSPNSIAFAEYDKNGQFKDAGLHG